MPCFLLFLIGCGIHFGHVFTGVGKRGLVYLYSGGQRKILWFPSVFHPTYYTCSITFSACAHWGEQALVHISIRDLFPACFIPYLERGSEQEKEMAVNVRAP